MMAAGKWNGVICLECGHDVSEYDKSVLPGWDPDDGSE